MTIHTHTQAFWRELGSVASHYARAIKTDDMSGVSSEGPGGLSLALATTKVVGVTGRGRPGRGVSAVPFEPRSERRGL